MAALARVHSPLLHFKMGFVHVVVAASANVAEQFLKVHDGNFSCRPPSSGAKHMAYNYHDLVFAPYGPRWRLLRKICALHLFSTKALDDFRHVRQGGEWSAMDLVVEMREAEEFKAMVDELMGLAGVFNISDFIPPLEGLDLQGVVAKMKKLHARFDAFLTSILKEHKIKGSNGMEGHVNLLSTLIDVDDGTDTTSSTVEWAIAELIRNPKILAQAQQELDSVVGKGRLVIESDLSQLTFLQAIIKENFRLHPSTPLSIPRIAQDNCEIADTSFQRVHHFSLMCGT
ncbi:hypothetical protein DH2020_013089 [Rehmannia glutinosa]|uniref:Flavonoid 3'-hydroxylase n=1 Tax=Rehmannia glutinosa TaxID=99300 RepID=A0ABR0X527_REHGL